MASEGDPGISQVEAIPRISTPKGSGTAVLLNNEALSVGGPSPGAVEWLHHQACFSYSVPSAQSERLVEQTFRLCRYDAQCAQQSFSSSLQELGEVQASSGFVEAKEKLLAWWCRRAWEDRRIKEAAEALKRRAGLERAAALASYCRFASTAKKVAQQACQVSGGQQDCLSPPKDNP